MALEPRMVFDGALVVTDAFVTLDHDVMDQGGVDEVSLAAAVPAALSEPAQARHEIVFVDQQLADLQGLLESIGNNRQIVLLNPDEALVDQINAAVNGQAPFDAIHIVTHGAQGQLRLGGQVIDTANIAQASDAWQSLGASLTRDGDILLYGCDIAAGDTGRNFMQLLASLTQADVAASDDVTGFSGDWLLESQQGLVEAGALSAPGYENDLWAIASPAVLPAGTTLETGNTNPNSGATTSAGTTFTEYNYDPVYGIVEGAWWGDQGGSSQPLSPRPTYNIRANAGANLTPLDLTFGDNTAGSGVRFTMLRTSDGSVQAVVDVNSTDYNQSLANGDYFYSTLQVDPNSNGLALNYLRYNTITGAKKVIGSATTNGNPYLLDSTLSFSNGGPLPDLNQPLDNNGAYMALVLYDVNNQTSTRLTPINETLTGSDQVVYKELTKVGLTPGGNYQLRFYVWRTDQSKTTVYVDNPMVYAAYNEAPVAKNDSFNSIPGAIINGNLISNDNGSGSDFDIEGQDNFIQKINGANFTIGNSINTANGVLTLTDAVGGFTYTPNAGFAGVDSFSYTITATSPRI